MSLEQILLAVFSYVLGAVPSGYWICKHFYKIDIRQHGSGNPGAANVYRTCGKVPGFATATLDSLKGYLPTLIALHRNHSIEFALAVGALAVLGHVWTIFLGFRGGKGVATSAGVCAALMPIPTLCATATFILGAALSGHISIGSMAAAAVLPIASVAMGAPAVLSWGAVALCVLILVRHKSNFERILLGRELHWRGKN